MKIPGTTRSAPVDPVRRLTPTRRQGSRPSSGGPAAHVQLSPAARELLEARSSEHSELVDDARVARLSRALRDGSFRIDYDRIAERMLQEEV